MADPKGFLTSDRGSCPARPVEERMQDWHEVYDPGGLLPIMTKQAGRCMDCGVPFCHNGCPLGQPHPRVERPGLPRRLAGGHRAAARHQQLPGVHRPALPGAVRGGVRARHQPAAGDDQERRGRHHRPGLGRGWVAAAAARAADRQDRRGRRLRPRGPGRRPAAHPGRARRRGVRARRPHRRPAAVRHPRVQDGEAAHRPAPRADARRGHRVPHRRRRSASTSTRRAAPRYDAVVLAGGATVSARPARRRAASWPASTRRWSTCRSPTRCRRATSTSPDHRRGQARRRHRRRRHRRGLPRHRAPPGRASVTQLEIMPRPADERARGPAVAHVPEGLQGRLRPRGGRRAGLLASPPPRFAGDDDGNVRALHLVEVEPRTAVRPRGGHRAGDPGRAGRCWRWASSAPSRQRPGRPARRRARRPGQHRPRRDLRDHRRRRVRRRRHGPRPVA